MRMWSARVRLISSIIAASVVDFPEPVGPVTSTIPRGRWVKLEQEVVLNAPKQADGILRVWVDGRLAVERTDLNYRMKPGVALSGVVADVFYGTEDGWGGAAPKDTKVSLTPFEVRWQ